MVGAAAGRRRGGRYPFPRGDFGRAQRSAVRSGVGGRRVASRRRAGRPALRPWQREALAAYGAHAGEVAGTSWSPRPPGPARRRSRWPSRATCWPAGWSTGSSWSARPITCAPSGPTPPRSSAWSSTRPCATPTARCRAGATATSPRMPRSPADRPSTPPAQRARRTLVVLDEIHHAGDGLSWGEAVAEAFDEAHRRLSLTGTPFRTRPDERIPFVEYETDGDLLRSVADHTYGYREALADGVVRPVVFAAYTGVSRWRNSAGEVIAASLAERRHGVGGGGGVAHRAGPVRRLGAARARRDGRADHPPAGVRHAGRGRAGAGQRPGRRPGLRRRGAPADRAEAGADPVRRPEGVEQDRAVPRQSDQRIAVCVRMISEGVDIPRAACLAWMTSLPHAAVLRPGRRPGGPGPRRARDGHGVPARGPAAAGPGRRTRAGPQLRDGAAAARSTATTTSTRCAGPFPRGAGRADRQPGDRGAGLRGRVRPCAALRPGGGRRSVRPRSAVLADVERRRRLPRPARPAQPGADRRPAGQAGRGAAPPGHRGRPRGRPAAGRATSRSRWGWRAAAALRREVNRLVGQVAARTGTPHAQVHGQLRRAVPGPPSAAAGAECWPAPPGSPARPALTHRAVVDRSAVDWAAGGGSAGGQGLPGTGQAEQPRAQEQVPDRPRPGRTGRRPRLRRPFWRARPPTGRRPSTAARSAGRPRRAGGD